MDDNLVLSHSQASLFTKCQLAWSLKYEEGLKAPRRASHFALGSSWHLILEKYRKELVETGSFDAAQSIGYWQVHNIYDEFPSLTEIHEAGDLLLWMWEGYLERWAEDDKACKWLLVEHEFKVPLIDGVEFMGMVDYVKQLPNGELVAGDTKTTSRPLDSAMDYDGLTFEPQFMRYLKALRETGLDISTFEWDAGHTKRLKRKMTIDERFRRVSSYISDTVIEQTWEELKNIAVHAKAVKQGKQTLLSDPNSYACRFCDFYKGHKLAIETGMTVTQACLEAGYTKKKDN